MKAIWQQQVLAESENTIVVEGNHYFPLDSLNREYFEPSEQKTHCAWKGQASYYDVVVDEKRNLAAAWYYDEPKAAASEIKGRVAFWKGVEVTA